MPQIQTLPGISSDTNSTQPTGQAVYPSLQALRDDQTLATQVAGLLASYDQQTGPEVSTGRLPRVRSGRYNTTDCSTQVPHLRWPNEGYKCPTKGNLGFNSLSIPQFVAGHMANCLQVSDHQVLRSMLTQLMMSMGDAAAMPWSAIRGAWATSMSDIEHNLLSWENQSQWSLNRLSYTRIAMTNSNQVEGEPKSRPCAYYNDNRCSSASSHTQCLSSCLCLLL